MFHEKIGQLFQGSTQRENLSLASATFYAERLKQIESIDSAIEKTKIWHSIVKSMFVHWLEDKWIHIPDITDPIESLAEWLRHSATPFDKYIVLTMFNILPTKEQLRVDGELRPGVRSVWEYAPWEPGTTPNKQTFYTRKHTMLRRIRVHAGVQSYQLFRTDKDND